MVGVRGFEPRASWSRTKRATNCATPRQLSIIRFFQRLSRLNFHQLRMMCAAGLNIPDATVCPAVLPYQAHMFAKGLQEWWLHVL